MKRFWLVIITAFFITACGTVNTNQDDYENTNVVENSEKEKETVTRKPCIVGEIISIENDYVYIKGAKGIYYNVYTADVSQYTVGNDLYVYYDEKEEIEDNLYKLVAERVEEFDQSKAAPKF